nr:MAG TPA: hypothetical protein [Caudoviricetes sp.]
MPRQTSRHFYIFAALKERKKETGSSAQSPRM